MANLPLPTLIIIILGVIGVMLFTQMTFRVTRQIKNENRLLKEGREILQSLGGDDLSKAGETKAGILCNWINQVSSERLTKQGVQILMPLLTEVSRYQHLDHYQDHLSDSSRKLIRLCRNPRKK